MNPAAFKMAFFVEGQTERVLLARILREYFGAGYISIDVFVSHAKKPYQHATDGMKHAPFHALIYDCTNDSRVITEVCDRFELMQSRGFSLIVAVRDLYPTPLQQMEAVRQAHQTRLDGLRSTSCGCALALFVHEVDASFFADPAHFERLFPEFDRSVLDGVLGYDWRSQPVDDIAHPSYKLDRVYNQYGSRYDKSEDVVRQAVNVLDIAHLMCSGDPPSRSLTTLFGILARTPNPATSATLAGGMAAAVGS